MTENAGERLFRAMEQIPDDLILEAAQGTKMDAGVPVLESEADAGQGRAKAADAGNGVNGGHGESDNALEGRKKRLRFKLLAEKLGGYLKYLPVAACLCLVFGGAGYVVMNFRMGSAGPGIYTGGSYDSGAAGQASEEKNNMDMELEDAPAPGDGEGVQESGASQDGDAGALSTGQEVLSLRYDAYEGPVFPLTATGDTQNLSIGRSIKAAVRTAAGGGGTDRLPVLHVADTYQIKNTSGSDKTLQIVYPFVTAFNQQPDSSGQILRIAGEPQAEVSYSIGESILAYRGADLQEVSSLEDYEQIFDAHSDYQEQALEKEADWNKTVQAYTFSDIRLREDAGGGRQGVIGVTVNAEGAKVLTYGFDHSFEREDGSSNYCFFLPGEQKKLVLIVEGGQDIEPQVGYYTNLDCVERMDEDGLEYEMHRQEMSYTNALRICANDAAGMLRQAVSAEASGEGAAPYVNADAVLRALTMASEEDAFYDTLRQRYQSTELSEVLERIFGEARVVYARATVTIPAKQSIQVTARTQKQKRRPDSGGQQYTFDLFPAAQSHLPLKKANFRLSLADKWKLAKQDLRLEQKKASVWKSVLSKKAYSFSVCFESETYENKD